MDPLSAKIIVDLGETEASECLVDHSTPSCIIDDSQLKTIALEDERLTSEEPVGPCGNAQYLLGDNGYRQAPTRSMSQGPTHGPTSKFHIFWDKAYFATAVGALRLSIMGSLILGALLLIFFSRDACHTEATPGAAIGVHIFVCLLTITAMVAWIAVDNSSFNYRFPFKWKLFDCCVYCALIIQMLISSSILVNSRNSPILIEHCKASIGKLDMAVAFSFLAVVVMLTLVTLRFFEKDTPSPSTSSSRPNPIGWLYNRRFSKSKQTQILLQPVA